jgi:membrane protein YfhO
MDFRSSFKRSIRHSLLVVLFYSFLFVLFFSPVLFYGSLLAPGGGRLGDALLYHVAYFASEKVVWDLLLSGGFPMTADPQVMSWYPPALLLSLIPGTWNVFVVSAYVMASCFTYGYVYALTESKFSGLVSGIIYGMCGFMMAHLGHTAMIHTAVWLPLIIWSLEMLRRRFTRRWLAIGCLAVACCVLAGHLQIVSYTLFFSAAYAIFLGWTAPAGRLRFYCVSLLLLLVGLGLATLQILPAAELAGLSTRASYGFSDFVTYSLPPSHILLMIFPAAFGGLPRYGVTPYFGEWNLTEMTAYVGLLPLMLAALGFVVARRKPVVIFWLSVGVVAFLLALGDKTPLASLAYHLPVIGKFRAPARHVIEMAFAFSVLAGTGTEAILRRKVTRRLALVTISAGAAIMLTGVLVVVFGKVTQHAAEKGVANLNMLPWSNLAVATPLLVFLVASAALIYWQLRPTSFFRKIMVLLVLVLDIASFGWFYSWHDFSPRWDVLIPPASAGHYRDLLQSSKQRMLSVRGTLGTLSELPPNLSRVWGVPNATGYSPLTLDRVTNLLSMLPDGSVAPIWKDAGDQSLNLAAVRYVYLPRSEITRDERGIAWHSDNMDVWLGSGCAHPPRNSVGFSLPNPIKATTIGIVSRLACSLPVADDEELVRVSIRDSAGNVQVKNIVAGRDTAEWAYDCRVVKPHMKHRQARVFSSFPSIMYDEPCDGHFYLAMLGLGDLTDVAEIDLQWVGRTGAITVEKVSLIEETTLVSHAISPLLANSNRWRFVEEVGEARIYENLFVKPRAWLVPATITLKPAEILKAIKTSQLPNGGRYDPSQIALVEENLALKAGPLDPAATAQVEELSPNTMQVHTDSVSPSFLVTSDTFYPGWQATVDGAPGQLFRANYALRGVPVPAGKHVVRFEFRPRTFYRGALISAVSILVLAGILMLPFRRPANRGYRVDTSL